MFLRIFINLFRKELLISLSPTKWEGITRNTALLKKSVLAQSQKSVGLFQTWDCSKTFSSFKEKNNGEFPARFAAPTNKQTRSWRVSYCCGVHSLHCNVLLKYFGAQYSQWPIILEYWEYFRASYKLHTTYS